MTFHPSCTYVNLRPVISCRHIYIPKNGPDGFPDSFFVSSLSEIMDAEGDDEDGGKRRGGGKGSGAGDCGICRFKEGGVRAVSLCIECKLELCGDCVAAHMAARITAAHTLVPVTAPGMLRTDNYCRYLPHTPHTTSSTGITFTMPLAGLFINYSNHQAVGQIEWKNSPERDFYLSQQTS